MEERVIVVFGATSRLGRAVVPALAGGGFRVRAVTRDTSTPAARRLAALLNVETVQGDIYSPDCVDALVAGAYGVFVHFHVDFNEPELMFRVTRMGAALVEACRRNNVQHVVHHTALSPLRTLGISAKHWDARAEVEVLFRQSGLNMTYLMVPTPFEAFLDFLSPERLSKDHYRVAIPIGNIPIDFIALIDVGEPVRQIFNHPTKFRSKTIALSAGKLTAKNVCDALTHHFSPIRFTDRQVTHHEFKNLKFDGSSDWSHAFEFLIRTDQQYNKNVTETLNPRLRSLSQWLCENHDDFVASLQESVCQ